MNERRPRRAALSLLGAGLALAAAGLVWRQAAVPGSAEMATAGERAVARSRPPLTALAARLEPQALAASQVPELVAALDTRVDEKTLQDLIDTEESWAGVRRAFPLAAVISGRKTLARSGPRGGELAGDALVETARRHGLASGLVRDGDRVYLAAGALIGDARQVASDQPVLLLGTLADAGALDGIARSSGDALGLSDGRRLLASAGPAALRPLLAGLVGREAGGTRPVPGVAAGGTPLALGPGLWLWVVFPEVGSGGLPAGVTALWILAAVLVLGGLVWLAATTRPGHGPARSDIPPAERPATRSRHRQPTRVGLQPPAAAHPTPAVAAAALPRQTRPDQMGRYRLLRPIGEGGMAEVYLAEAHGPEGFKRHFVVKRLHPHLASRKEAVAQFIDEARLQARLTHSNIVSVFDFGRSGEEFFLALEHVHGRDLEKLTHRHLQASQRGLPAPLVFFVLHEVLEALAYAHDRASPTGEPLGIVHRDVSPANVLISYRGDVKLSDFGIVKAAGRVSKTDERVVKGNVNFMSPEQARGEAVDARSDLFSVGLVMFTCLTGRTLYDGQSIIHQLMRAAVGPVTEHLAQLDNLPAEAGNILGRALAFDPADRFQSAAEFASALRALGLASKSELATLMKSYYAADMQDNF